MSSRQRRNGRQIAMFFTQLVIGPKSSARSGQDSTQIGFLPPQHGHNNHRIWSYGLSFRYMRCAIRASHMAVAAANAHIFSTTTKPSSRLCIAPLGQTLVKPDLRSGCTKSTDSRQTRSVPDTVIFLPVAASIFINAAELTSGVKSL